jgi:hypothetical protein
MNHHAAFGGINLRLIPETDYYESRTSGRIFMRNHGSTFWAGVSSDYRRALALDGEINFGKLADGMYDGLPGENWFNWWIRPRIRISDKFTLQDEFRVNNNFNQVGYVNGSGSDIYFGGRDVQTYINTLTGRYLFKNNLFLSLRARHYWSSGDYSNYYELKADGDLASEPGYDKNHNCNANFFNVDLVFEWWFAPGSTLNIIWKNAIATDEGVITRGYLDNLDRTLQAPQLNSLSIKALYFFDYQYIAKAKKRGNDSGQEHP